MQSRFEARSAEPRIYAFWEENNAFLPRGDGQTYCVMIPPPNVTGVLHMGHALNITLQDILCRFARLNGRRVLWQPGTDHAGIATQLVVEKDLSTRGISRFEIGRDAFLEEVNLWKDNSQTRILGQLKRLGASCDWSRLRFTMDEGFSVAVRQAFVSLYEQGLVYRDRRMVNWDPHFGTAISDLEVENRETAGHFWHIKYPLAGGRTYSFPTSDGNEQRDYISIATTRPETMLGDGAVAVHPEDERYQDLIGSMVNLPVAEREIPIIADTHPDPEFGSGAVKITGAHDFNDFEVARRHGLQMTDIMDDSGCMAGDVPERYQGLDRFLARERIVAELAERGLILRIEDKPIQQPFGDRSGVVVEPRLKEQWFVDAKKLAGKAMDAVEKGQTRFVPETWAKTYFDWMRDIQPWCISRQLWWGHQIPAWYAQGRVFVAYSEAEARTEAEALLGRDVELIRDEDVLDTWFSSALWPMATLGWPDETDPAYREYFPTTALVTGFDIIFFWVARMMMQSLHFTGHPPFADVYVHALVRDAKGQKMSKSKGNVIDPLELIDSYGADALRFTLAAMATQGRDIKLSRERVAGYRNFGSKLWNAARFQTGYPAPEGSFDPAAARLPVNAWIIAHTARCARDTAHALEAYRFDEAASSVYRFVWNKLCDWYLELVKPILDSEDGHARAETRHTLAWVIKHTLTIAHPFMPFITEEIHTRTADGSPCPLTMARRWPQLSGLTSNRVDEIDWIVSVVQAVRSARADLGIPAGARLGMAICGLSPERATWTDNHRDVMTRMLRLDSCAILEESPAGQAHLPVPGGIVSLDIDGLIDPSAEINRLRNAIARTHAEIERCTAKLGDDNFRRRAPQEVVAEHQKRQARAKDDHDRLCEALAMLDGS